MTDDVPEPWAAAMLKKGYVDRRRQEPVPGLRALADAAGLTPETVRRLVHGIGEADSATVKAVAGALGRPVDVVARWAGQARAVRDDYEPPDEAHLLDEDERDAVDRIIRLLAENKKGLEREQEPTTLRRVANKRPDNPPTRS